MPLQYKIDVVAALKDKGYTSYKIRQEKLLSESTIQKLRSGNGVSWENIETLCRLLDCQPGDLLHYTADQPGLYSRSEETQNQERRVAWLSAFPWVFLIPEDGFLDRKRTEQKQTVRRLQTKRTAAYSVNWNRLPFILGLSISLSRLRLLSFSGSTEQHS